MLFFLIVSIWIRSLWTTHQNRMLPELADEGGDVAEVEAVAAVVAAVVVVDADSDFGTP